ncbi:MAG: SCO family protein [Acidobacteria bacterium]|nr:SCO family protein [Acidobacteriota bacterium]
MRSVIFTSILLCGFPLWSQTSTEPLVDGVGVQEHLGEFVDLNLTFVDESGETVQLSDFAKPGRPMILAPVYYSCPRMCTLVLNGVADLVRQLDLVAGEDYTIVCVSFDPSNTAEMATAKKANYLDSVRPKDLEADWHFLTGTPESIETLMGQIGFHYKWVNDAFSHASILVFLGDQGKISRYLYGVNYPVRDARMALVETSQGKVGTTLDRILIYCFHYDPLAGKYTFMATKIMRIGAVAAVLLIAVIAIYLVKKPSRTRRMELHG